MQYQDFLASKKIYFDVDFDDNLIDNLAFIHLIKMKFYGDELSAEFFVSKEEKSYQVKISFFDYESCSEAKAHCDRNISHDGSVVADYRGALDKADPHRIMAKAMKKRAEANANIIGD